MGLRDHLEDGTGHVLSPGLDLDYLHVDAAERQADVSGGGGGTKGAAAAAADRGEVGLGHDCGGRSSRSSTGSWNFSEESAVSDSEDERLAPVGPGRAPGDEAPPPPAADRRAKMEFALKLGYSQELVLLVLGKLGPDALINDVLGELVKLGTRTEAGTHRGAGPGGGPGPGPGAGPGSGTHCPMSPSSSSSLDSCRLLRDEKENLRPVVVDGSNVAMSHGNKEVFSCQGIQLAVDWFLERGHRDVTVFVPAWRKEQSRPDALISDQEILRRLEKEKILVFTPSRRVQGRRVVCYDDRFIVKLAYESDGVIVSNDNYRDLANEKPEWKRFIDERLLMYSFVNDKFMPPDDPLGRHGPSLENFLRKRPVFPEHRRQPCPYGKKCTYGHKCKFYHPERGNQPQRSVADELRAKMSSAVSRVQPEDVPVSRGGGGAGRPEASRKLPSPWNSYGDTPEVQVQPRGEPWRTLHGPPAPGGPPSSGIPDQRDPPWTCGPSRSAVQSPVPRVRSALNPPEFFFPAASDGSSDGSVCSDTFSPDAPEDGPRCLHHHLHPPLAVSYVHPEEPLRPFGPSRLAPRHGAPLWPEDPLSDSGVYNNSPLPSRRSLPALGRWPTWGGPGYNPLAYRSLPELHAESWSPLPRGRSPRERAFVSLCGIFPADLVRRVMSRIPHLSDAQELAAAILMEKTHGGV